MCTRVLASLALLVRVAHCFSWDIVLAGDKRLEFLNNGTLEHTEEITGSKYINAVTYDTVHNRVLFSARHNTMLFSDRHNTNMSIYSFDLRTRKIKHVLTKKIDQKEINGLAYDPVTQLLFWKETNMWFEYDCDIYSLSLKPASSEKAVDGKLLVKSHTKCRDIAVDSCGGFIYWVTDNEIERAAFDGSKREVLVKGQVFFRQSMSIDQQTQKMYWIEAYTVDWGANTNFSIKCADLNGKNIKTFYYMGPERTASSLTVSKDFIYWWSFDQTAILQLKKCEQDGAGPIVHPIPTDYPYLAAKYTIKEQTLGIQGCEALKNTSSDPNSMDVELTEVHATKVSAECHRTTNQQSTTCHNYCVNGNCSVSAEGHPKCSCEAGFSGERCEVNVCYKHCLNGGVCSLSEEEEPVCQCPADYEGDRCNVATTKTDVCACADQMKQQILLKTQRAREDLQSTLQLYSDKLDESAAKIQICKESLKNDFQNLDETTSKKQT